MHNGLADHRYSGRPSEMAGPTLIVLNGQARVGAGTVSSCSLTSTNQPCISSSPPPVALCTLAPLVHPRRPQVSFFHNLMISLPA